METRRMSGAFSSYPGRCKTLRAINAIKYHR